MRRAWLLPLAVPAMLAAACSDPATTHGSALVGRWVTEARDVNPRGWYERELVFSRGGEFGFVVRNFGLYAEQSRNEASSYSRTDGTYEVHADRIVFHPERLILWDHFYGANSPEEVIEPYPWGTIFDDARYEMNASRLTIHHTTYPADAPVATTSHFLRR